MAKLAPRDFKRQLDKSHPAASNAQLGTWLYELSAQLTDLTAKHNALLAHLDTANVAGIGNTNAATFGETLVNTLPENRT